MGKMLQVAHSLVLDSSALTVWIEIGMTLPDDNWETAIKTSNTYALSINEPTANILPYGHTHKSTYQECSRHHSLDAVLDKNARD